MLYRYCIVRIEQNLLFVIALFELLLSWLIMIMIDRIIAPELGLRVEQIWSLHCSNCCSRVPIESKNAFRVYCSQLLLSWWSNCCSPMSKICSLEIALFELLLPWLIELLLFALEFTPGRWWRANFALWWAIFALEKSKICSIFAPILEISLSTISSDTLN